MRSISALKLGAEGYWEYPPLALRYLSAITRRPDSSRVRKRRGRPTADNCRGLVDQLVILDGLYHEQGKVYAARDIALEDGVAYVPTPHGQSLALALFEIASADDCPPRITGEYSPTCFHLVVEVREANEPRDPAEGTHDPPELPRVYVLAVSGDVPPTREHEPRPRRSVV